MFENPALHASWQPFLDITEEEEKILRGFGNSTSSFNDYAGSDEDCNNNFYSRSQIAYQRLTSDGRKNINKYAKSDFLDALDEIIYNFIFDKYQIQENDFFVHAVCLTSNRLSLTMKDSHHRLMAHSVSTFYNATSISELNNDGVKVVMVTRPNKYSYTPQERLVDFLSEQRADVAYWTKPNISRPKKRCGMSAVPLSEFSNEANVGWV